MRIARTLVTFWLLAALVAGGAWATTLEQLSLDEMIRQSTAIVRAQVTATHAANRNGTIYTYYRLQVRETLKASSGVATGVEVAVPGGTLGRMMQSVAGAPELRANTEYVLFLWTSRSGLTQIIGLSQGALSVRGAGLARAASGERMLDQDGHVVVDQGLSVSLKDLRARIGGQK
jgi:hypothetical protein